MSDTKVLSLMFHRINDKSLGYSPAVFARYLDYLRKNFPIVTPGDHLPDVPLAICLTFDDAYFDFYQDVYPLLQSYKIKALLAVPVKYIISKTSLSPEIRLSVPYAHNMDDSSLQAKVPFCTWQELKEMADSQFVIIASHGYQHANLRDNKTNVEQEVVLSKAILEEKLQMGIHHFVYPFGRTTRKVHQLVCQHYQYGIRIGSAVNKGWDLKRHFIYRINADPLWTDQKPIDAHLIRKLSIKYWNNRIRFF